MLRAQHDWNWQGGKPVIPILDMLIIALLPPAYNPLGEANNVPFQGIFQFRRPDFEAVCSMAVTC
jgi:hypothetical protein